MATPERRFELVLLDVINAGLSRCGIGFGKYPLGLRDAVEPLLPFVNPDDKCAPFIAKSWEELKRKLDV